MTDTLLSLWHDLRAPLLVLACVAAVVIRLWLRPQRQESPTIPLKSNSLDTKFELQPSNPKPQENAERTPSRLVESKPPIPAQPRIATKAAPKRIVGRKPKAQKDERLSDDSQLSVQPLVFFSSLGGTTEKAAQSLTESLSTDLRNSKNVLKPQLLDLSYIEYDDYFTHLPKQDPEASCKYFYILLIPTYNIDTILNNFLAHLNETHNDFRVDTAPLIDILGYTVFGFGDAEGWPTEAEGFCSQAKEVDKWLARLTGRKRAYPLGMGDVQSDAEARLQEWSQGVEEVLVDLAKGKSLGEGVAGSGDPLESDDEDDLVSDVTSKDKKNASESSTFDDMENLGGAITVAADELDEVEPIDFTTYKLSKPAPISAPKEMVPKASPTYAALTKQGYTIVGSHSGVKICRWTKSALRGRGSCYKFSFYGIKSHLCMETTPSLSCSNKCVFCWRHGTNPVGTTWRWQVDQPDAIFAGVKEGHYKKIKMMRGVPGVRAERFEEAMRIRHCALSLVGEPIFYPYINEFTALLHAEHISSFLVCNAQHPDQLATLRPVTQLYVSIDASNRDSLRKIDRPLHRDFWERFLACLDIIREKRYKQRTVFRLTLVKGFNIEDEAEGYADLVARGLPCFVEVKGVTYCGTSTSAGAGLTMQNVPFYEEVQAFVLELEKSLRKRGLDYGIAAEHAHSCCVLLGSTRFLKNGKWNTVIDYEKFFELLETGEEFKPEEYVKETPEWAAWGRGGFDPADERVYTRGKTGKAWKAARAAEEKEKMERERAEEIAMEDVVEGENGQEDD